MSHADGDFAEFLFTYLRRAIVPAPLGRDENGTMFDIKNEQPISKQDEMATMMQICYKNGIDERFVWERELLYRKRNRAAIWLMTKRGLHMACFGQRWEQIDVFGDDLDKLTARRTTVDPIDLAVSLKWKDDPHEIFSRPG